MIPKFFYNANNKYNTLVSARPNVSRVNNSPQIITTEKALCIKNSKNMGLHGLNKNTLNENRYSAIYSGVHNEPGLNNGLNALTHYKKRHNITLRRKLFSQSMMLQVFLLGRL